MPAKFFTPSSNYFGMSSGNRKAKPTSALSCKPTRFTEERVDAAWSTVQDAVDADDVHVQLIYDYKGNILSCKAEPVTRVESPDLIFDSVVTDDGEPYIRRGIGPEPLERLHELSSQAFHSIDLSDGKKHPVSSPTLAVATLPMRLSAPPSPALSATSTLVDDAPAAPEPKAKEFPDINDFEAIKVLGRGAQGVVTLVRNKSTGLCHALKSVNTTKLCAPLYIRALEEQDVLKRLAGIPWFVELHASFYDREHFSYVTKYYHNGTLSALMERGRLPAPEVRRLAAELVFTLGVLQQKRVIHGDIKPKNLLLDERGHLVLADFGMARCFATRRADLPWRGLEEAFVEADVLHPTDPEFERVDVTCRVVGTPVYAAPEVWLNERTPQSYPADVWSAGVVIFEMLFGRLPFGPHNIAGWAHQRCQNTVRRELEFPEEPEEEIDESARDLMRMMLQVDAGARPNITAIKRHPYFKSIKWAEIAMRQADVHTPFPKPGLRHYIEREPDAALPTQAPYDEPVPEERNPWAWFPWVSPDINAPQEATYIAVNPPPDYSAIVDNFVPPVVQAVKASPSEGAIPGLGAMWGALKRMFAFAA